MIKKQPTFEQAINASLLWCNAWDQGELSDEVLAQRVSELLVSKNGARGFFAISLASDCPLMDRLPDVLIVEIRAAGKPIVDLIAKNLAMSTAMSVHHSRQKDFTQKESSERVKERCIELLRSLETSNVKERLQLLLDATKGKGIDVQFLEKWGYDDQQKQAIASSIHSIAEN